MLKRCEIQRFLDVVARGMCGFRFIDDMEIFGRKARSV